MTDSLNSPRFPIVGIGASAGGLEAFTKLLNRLPMDTGMAFVLIQHLDPKHVSMSAEILSRTTGMPVAEVKEGMRVEPNCIYIIPPNFSMKIVNGALALIPRTESRGQHLVIDFFLESLAKDQKNFAVGVVLSGTGSDGTEGLSSIKAEGGITIAQTPATAKFDGMPQSAIAAGNVDLILSPEEVADELARIAKYSNLEPGSTLDNKPLSPATHGENKDSLDQIFLLLRNQCQVDFSFYKSNTIMRRISRRMVLKKAKDLKEYSEYLSGDSEEVKALFSDILINVTEFFRNPEAFQALKEEVFPKLLENRGPGVPIRIWVPGCSTGEEVYSIAIALIEYLGNKYSQMPILIFASDVSDEAIYKARLAEYPETISKNVSSERLVNYFSKMENGGYKIKKAVRDLCLFSRHDVTSDPPFAKIDLISCRNLLIYFSSSLQKHVLPIFHYSLIPNRFLWLGKSESVGGFSDLFDVVDKPNNIYIRKDAPILVNLRFPSSTYFRGFEDKIVESKTFAKATFDVQKVTEKAMQETFPGVVVNEELNIVQMLGRPHPFIELAPGAPSYYLLNMVHPKLVRELRNAIQAAKTSKVSVRKEDLSIGEFAKQILFNLIVIPTAPLRESRDRLYVVLFEKTGESKLRTDKKSTPSSSKTTDGDKSKDADLLELQQELDEFQEYQGTLIRQFEGTQEDLSAANEELQSANEELQSTKEELQSSNEELSTVNDELQVRSHEQSQANNDLINLLDSVEIPIVMLGIDKKVRRFTPLALKALNLIPSDIGRPLNDLRLTFNAGTGNKLNLDQMVSDTIRTLQLQELEVQDEEGRWFRLQVRPYKTIDNMVDGAVLVFVDINNLKLNLKEVKEANGEAERAHRAKDLFLATLSHELRTPLTAIISWSQMIQSGKLDLEKMRRGAKVIEESGKIQSKLINDLLEVSRIIAGKISLEFQEINPSTIVESAIDSVQSLADDKSIKIETSFAPNIGTILADRVRLQQVFWNLLSNAIKFSPEQAVVTVGMSRIKGDNNDVAQVMIKVTDSGKGIDSQFLPNIFEHFTQEDNTSVRVHGGLGLGLAIAKNLVELHGGSIKAESLGHLKGATFTVMLPLKSDQELLSGQEGVVKFSESSGISGEESITLAGIRVLIVDDEANAREAIRELLSSYGADTKAVESVKEALDLFQKFKPDVLLSDIAMPGEDGYDLIKKIRALGPDRGANVPALALSAYASAEDVQHALSAGFQAHLAKPVNSSDLVRKIVELAGSM